MFKRSNDETNAPFAGHPFRHLSIGHSDIDSSFEFRHSSFPHVIPSLQVGHILLGIGLEVLDELLGGVLLFNARRLNQKHE